MTYQVRFTRIPKGLDEPAEFVELETSDGRGSGDGEWKDEGHSAVLMLPDPPCVPWMARALDAAQEYIRVSPQEHDINPRQREAWEAYKAALEDLEGNGGAPSVVYPEEAAIILSPEGEMKLLIQNPDDEGQVGGHDVMMAYMVVLLKLVSRLLEEAHSVAGCGDEGVWEAVAAGDHPAVGRFLNGVQDGLGDFVRAIPYADGEGDGNAADDGR